MVIIVVFLIPAVADLDKKDLTFENQLIHHLLKRGVTIQQLAK